jgi:peptidoglycan/LPS O-acetylase OafA/YrhL
MQPTHKYLSNLTPLRAIAAIWVVVFHIQVISFRFVFPQQTKVLFKGYLMVDLFFIMSGFIICHVYQQSFEAGIALGNFRKFIVARFARIYPLHFFTLAILIGFIAITHGWNMVDDPKAILPNLFLIHSFGVNKIYTWNVPSWSISAEWWAYMVFPLVILFIHRKKTLAIITLGLLVVLAYVALIFWIPHPDPFDPTGTIYHDLNATYDYGFLRGLAGFVSGILLYKVYELRLWATLFRRDLTALVLMIVIITCMHFGINDGYIIILFIALVYVFTLNNGRLHVLCNNRFLQYLGKISYSIYLSSLFTFIIFSLVKLPGLQYSDHGATTSFWIGVGWTLVFLIIHIGISSLTYYFIEAPCRKYINAKFGKDAPTPSLVRA